MNLFHSHISEQTHSINNIHCSTRADCLFGVTDSVVLSLPRVFPCKAISIHEIPCHHRDTAWLYGEKKFMSHIHEFSLPLNLLPPPFCYISASLAKTLLPRGPYLKQTDRKYFLISPLFVSPWRSLLSAQHVIMWIIYYIIIVSF